MRRTAARLERRSTAKLLTLCLQCRPDSRPLEPASDWEGCEHDCALGLDDPCLQGGSGAGGAAASGPLGAQARAIDGAAPVAAPSFVLAGVDDLAVDGVAPGPIYDAAYADNLAPELAYDMAYTDDRDVDVGVPEAAPVPATAPRSAESTCDGDCASVFEQCAGKGIEGSLDCCEAVYITEDAPPSRVRCVKKNDFYSQVCSEL